MRRIFWLGTFFLGLPLLFLGTVRLLFMSLPIVPASPFSPEVLGISSPEFTPYLSAAFTYSDARALSIRRYLHRYGSPLEPYSDQIIAISDKYRLDYRLLVAIARQESNLCKIIPKESHNCWGYGIYGDQVIRFRNYPEAMETVAKTLKRKYIDQGLDTPEEIMAKYTPPSLEKDGAWAKAINQFLTDLE
ncbi:MAG: hypothetical protein UX91_C0005G0036 [Candidatus Amesbacteria bacterium GW2011_GWB1_47_19]|nr:MAG: hypothetical protein UW51_C0007G0036 [Candidatus Amesbacteria bacterium GW2011_GWA1_44_24]KKU31118.1 MAG: hypothetical protein UX46_C0007G0036 [Candidatus Amesbacteria bacterium GW2011_GWC1_46_24]KKU67239.1 MAG: hypothetical protein UX91_C0005G0036 [Candidatus Amesbacteria bacterium GW2011_GWB1_47_19]OGD05796.1 MAG: hypothetical protein A2379_01585 [Candidatus Amesbacteria bacterium RIFOXYB1_FULL_47_13]HBC72655.1 hypothetical protein [Candidatus Amesbacteria bacterium]